MGLMLRAGVDLFLTSMRELRGLRFGLAWQLALLLISVVSLPLDHRRVLGLNPWIKPIKFELSVVVFLVTVAMLLAAIAAGGRWMRATQVLAWMFALCMTVENTIIATQSLRGVPSHMNVNTGAVNAALFSVMGLFIALNTVLLGVVLVLWFAGPVPVAAAMRWAVALGLVFQLAAAVEGVRIVMNNGHTVAVGAASGAHSLTRARALDSGPGLPVLNWSTQHGDLRVAHFFALHALQLLPLAALLLIAAGAGNRTQVVATCATAVVYAAGTWWLFAQAMRGVPLIAAGG